MTVRRHVTPAVESAMPHVYRDVENLKGKPLAGTGDCVALVKQYVPGLQGKPTISWKAGAHVMDKDQMLRIARGTAIATFVNGRYPGLPTGNHAAIVLSVMPSGIWVVDQWKNDPTSRPEIRARFIRIPPPRQITRKDGSYIDPSNNAMAFFVIEL